MKKTYHSRQLEGILCVDKPQDWTSFDVVAKMRGIADCHKIGHGGTLDPMATGVLPLFFGRSAKAMELMPVQDKRYTASIRFGVTTDTQDCTGNILSTSEKPVTLTLSSSFRNQKAIELMMAEIEHKRMGRVSFDADGRFSAVDDSSDTVRLLNYSKNSANAAVIAKLEPPGTPLDKRLNVAFSINARKELTATVHDNLTGQDIYVDMPLVALR